MIEHVFIIQVSVLPLSIGFTNTHLLFHTNLSVSDTFLFSAAVSQKALHERGTGRGHTNAGNNREGHAVHDRKATNMAPMFPPHIHPSRAFRLPTGDTHAQPHTLGLLSYCLAAELCVLCY